MGYYTHYTVKVVTEEDMDPQNIKFYFEELTDYPFNLVSSLGTVSFESSDSIKWYDYHDDCQKVLKQGKFGIKEIIVSGIGEEHGDYWSHKFTINADERVNGKIVFPEFSI